MTVNEDLPVIDISHLGEVGTRPHDEAVAAIGAACREIGFFYVIGHGIPEGTLAEMFKACRLFFDQGAETKSDLSIEKSGHNRGYVAYQGEQLEASRPGDLKEAFNIGLELASDDPELLAGIPFRGPNQWPANLPGWRAQMLDYYSQMLALADRLHRAFASDLGATEGFFVPYMERPLAVLRLLHYLPIAAPDTADGKAIGAGTHSDYGMLTLLLQDDVSGLQVRKRDGTWIDAPVVPNAFICNIGDMLMRWSNDIYVSTPHRVINDTARDRYSIAMFCDPAPDAPVTCLPSCCSKTNPPKYAPTTSGDYLTGRLNATYSFRSEEA